MQIQAVREELQAKTGSRVMINIQEIKNPDAEAQVVAEGVAASLERRISFRRAMKQSIFRAMKSGAKGIKIQCAGRLGGAEIARTEWYLEGQLRFRHSGRHRLRFASSYDLRVIGIKVWIYKGEVMERKPVMEAVPAHQERG